MFKPVVVVASSFLFTASSASASDGGVTTGMMLSGGLLALIGGVGLILMAIREQERERRGVSQRSVLLKRRHR